jgi:type IV pilus assembly protein PilQ
MRSDKNLSIRIKNRGSLFVLGFVLVVLAAIAVGEVEQGTMEPGGSENVERADVFAGGMIQSLTFKKDMRIRDALTFLALKYNKNIVPSPQVEGQLAFTSLFDVTFEEAMDAILGGKFAYEQKGNLIEVFVKGDVNRMRYEVFRLNYISAAEARKLIAPILSNSGKVGVTSPADTGVPTGQSISAGAGGGDTMSLKDTVVVYDYAENIARAKRVIAAIDVRPKQVLVEATILNVTLTEDMQFGIDWQTLKGVAVTALTGIAPGAPDYFKSAGTSQVTKSGGMTVGIALGDVAAFIRAVEEVTDVTILANPKILAVNKQLGQVYIGQKVGYREGDKFDAAGNLVEGEIKFLDTGTKLSFRPYIGSDGHIRMDIHSKDSSDSTAAGIPSEISAELVSNIMVKDGETVVIGGLFRDKVTTKKTQIPLLGDLPIIGAVFKGTADTVERSEVIVLLAPHIIEEPGQTNGQARANDVSIRKFGAGEQLQWTGRTKLSEERYADAVRYYVDGDNEAAMHKLDAALRVSPTHLEAIRLKERIISETDPDRAARMERILLDTIDEQDSSKWQRR